jgi:integrase
MAILAECPICHKKQATKNKVCKCGWNLDDAKKSKKVRYWIGYRMPDGKQRRESVGALEGLDPYSITDAKDALSKRQVQKRERKIFDMMPDSEWTFNELSEWFLPLEQNRVLSGKISEAYYPIKKINIESFNSVFGDTLVSAIEPADLVRYQAKRKQDKKSDSYIDQEIGAAKSMINSAFDNRKVDADTLRVFRSVDNLLKKGSNSRDKVLTYGEYKELMDALPSHTKTIVATAFWTGMRRSEILGLEWNKVDLSGRMIRLKASDTKEKHPKKIPISKTLQKILKKLPNRLSISGKKNYVFLYKSKPVSDIRTGLIKGCKAAGIPYGQKTENGFIFHDLRRTAKTIARKAGVDKNIRMVIFGHSNPDDMDSRYDIVDEGDLLTAVDQVEAFLQSVDHSVDQGQKNGSQTESQKRVND